MTDGTLKNQTKIIWKVQQDQIVNSNLNDGVMHVYETEKM